MMAAEAIPLKFWIVFVGSLIGIAWMLYATWKHDRGR